MLRWTARKGARVATWTTHCRLLLFSGLVAALVRCVVCLAARQLVRSGLQGSQLLSGVGVSHIRATHCFVQRYLSQCLRVRATCLRDCLLEHTLRLKCILRGAGSCEEAEGCQQTVGVGLTKSGQSHDERVKF